MTQRKLLITGAGGFTGRHAVNYFVSAGAEVTAAVRRLPVHRATPEFPEGVKLYGCDLSDRKAVDAMIQTVQPDEILHLAGKNAVEESWRDPLLYMETNIMSTLYLLEAARSRPSLRILVAGSRLKYRPGYDAGPPHPYSLSKTIGELVALAWGTLFKQPVLLAEPCNLIGPGPSTGFCSLLAQHIVRSEAGASPLPFKLSSRFAKRDFLDVRDAVRAYDLILRKGSTGTVYRIDSGAERTLGDITEQLLSFASSPVPIDWGPEEEEPPKVNSAGGAASSAPVAVPEEKVNSLGWSREIRLGQSLEDVLNYYRGSREGRLS